MVKKKKQNPYKTQIPMSPPHPLPKGSVAILIPRTLQSKMLPDLKRIFYIGKIFNSPGSYNDFQILTN